MKKFLLIILFTLISFQSVASANSNLTDINGKWYENYAIEAIANGWINGYPDNTFRGDNSITMGEFISIVINVFNLEQKKSNNIFTDVTSNDWYYDDILTSLANNILPIYNAQTTLSPNEPILRQDAFTIIGRLEYFKAIESSRYIAIDINSIEHYAQTAIIKLYNLRIIQGDQNGNLNAQNSITRAEAITLLKRVYNVINNIPEPFIDPIFEAKYDETSSSPSIYLMNPHDMYNYIFDFSFESPKELNEFSYIPPHLTKIKENREYINYLTDPYHVNLLNLYPPGSKKLMFVVPKWKLNNYWGPFPDYNQQIKIKIVVYKDETDKHVYYLDVYNRQ